MYSVKEFKTSVLNISLKRKCTNERDFAVSLSSG